MNASGVKLRLKSFFEGYYFPRKHRYHYPTLILMGIELPFTIVILTFTGIASHDLYQSKLWQDGADNGFNSAPDEILYAMANYRPYSVPMVWNSKTTDFNLAIGVLSTFFLITKFPLHVLRLFYPPVAAFIHAGLFAIYVASATFQAGSDMSDPKHPQKRAPWFIAKSCSVAKNPDNIKYCKQSKALFAMTIIVMYANLHCYQNTATRILANKRLRIIYFVELVMNLHSCILTSQEKAEHQEHLEDERTMKEYEEEIVKSPSVFPMTPGVPNTGGIQPFAPYTPHTPQSFHFGFGTGSSDLPLRNNAAPPNEHGSMRQQESMETLSTGPQVQTHTLFPPPKAVTK